MTEIQTTYRSILKSLTVLESPILRVIAWRGGAYTYTTYLFFLITGETKDEAREACDIKGNSITEWLKRQTRV